MIKKFCAWYLRTFPPKKPEGKYPAEVPWQVVVVVTTDTGYEHHYVDFTKDRLSRWMGDDDWTTAKDFALSRADSIKTNGFTQWVEGTKEHYPLHRIYLVMAYPKPILDVKIKAEDKASEKIEQVREAIDNLDSPNV